MQTLQNVGIFAFLVIPLYHIYAGFAIYFFVDFTPRILLSPALTAFRAFHLAVLGKLKY